MEAFKAIPFEVEYLERGENESNENLGVEQLRQNGNLGSAISITKASVSRVQVPVASVVEEIAPRQKQFTTPMERAVNNSINRRQAPSSAPSQAENKEETTHKRRNFLSKFFGSRGKKGTEKEA